MRPGDVIADRFVADSLTGVGGMGSVFKAHDRHTDEPVALKVMRDKHDGSAVRFFLEARVLADLRHPGIVRDIAHGATVSGEHWLAMEWLEGTSLAERLATGPLTIAETLALAGRVAEALSLAHGRGVVHRDVKPSNLFLVGGSCERVKILDFGVARLGQPALAHTASGRRVGTPRYMAPEQVRGERDLDARVDVFALGCVVYHALAGRPAFASPAGDDEMAVFAEILRANPAPIAAARPEVPPALDQLVARMLAKDANARPSDAGAVLQALAELTADTTDRALAATGEQRLYSVILADGQPPLSAVRAVALRHGGHPEILPDGTLTVTLSGGRSAVEQAAQGARLALALARVTDGRVALATGRARRTGRRLLGEALERAAALLGARPRGVYLDDVSAALLAGSFVVDGDRLVGASERADPDRTVLGKVTPFVGRERELRTLEALFDECVVDRVARVVLVTAPPGMGKSRLRRELALRLSARHPDLAYFLGRGDPMRAGSPFALIAPALRSATGVHDGDPLDLAEQKILAQTSQLLPRADADRVAEFLGEIVGVPFVDRGRVQLRAARGDPC